MEFLRFFVVVICLSLFAVTAYPQKPDVKKNARPSSDSDETKKKAPVSIIKGEIAYTYEFEKPEFVVAKVVITHDENGNGEITFRERDFEEDISEPLAISPATLEKLKELWVPVNFLESKEKFQSDVRDYGHLGTMKLRMKKGDVEREEVFNWTENLDVRALYEEYRKIGTLAVWMFDFEVAKRNQPLRTPQMMTGLDSHVRRNAIPDPPHIVPYLKKLSGDESIPLIARNHAARIAQKIESAEKKSDKPVAQKQ